jgi:hypothetical protein
MFHGFQSYPFNNFGLSMRNSSKVTHRGRLEH